MEKKSNVQDQVPETLRYWDSWRHVAPGRLKRISGGNLNGKTDINPIWRFEALTANFGPIGFGWNYREVERWTNECAGEVGAFVKIELRIKIDGVWSEPIEGVGGSKLCGKGHGDGLNDEAWKMATTDAISVACKSLGMAADVYVGLQSHDDPDQKKDGPDYGTKYEDRRGAPSGNTRQGPRVENRTFSSAHAGNTPGRVTVTKEMVDGGKARNLVAALAGHDYDDLTDWQNGLAELRGKYDFAPGVIEQIEQLAVAERNSRQESRIPAKHNTTFIPE